MAYSWRKPIQKVCNFSTTDKKSTNDEKTNIHPVLFISQSNNSTDTAALMTEKYGKEFGIIPVRYYSRKLDYTMSIAKHLSAQTYVMKIIDENHPLYSFKEKYL